MLFDSERKFEVTFKPNVDLNVDKIWNDNNLFSELSYLSERLFLDSLYSPYKFVLDTNVTESDERTMVSVTKNSDNFDISKTIDRILESFGMFNNKGVLEMLVKNGNLNIKKVIYNEPATIILWNDGTKTVVKCDKDDTYDPEKGFLLCVVKRILGNKGNFNNVLKEWYQSGGAKE